MSETPRDLQLLIEIAKIDAQLNGCRTELGLLPGRIARAKKSIEDITSAEASAEKRLKAGQSEHRALEQKLEDNAEQIKKYKTQLMEVKTNKEYTAMLNEIGHLDKDTDDHEERLLMLMDELDQLSKDTQDSREKTSGQKKELAAEQSQLEERMRIVTEEIKRVEAGKPKILSELNSTLKKRYGRLLTKMTDFAVTNVEDDTCQGCFTRIPPQTSVEVRQNNRVIACEACGRILVHYDV